MNNPFPPITIEYSGKEYTVPGNAVWGLIGAIEEHITYVRLATMMTKGELPRVKISSAMAAALTYAGCPMTPERFSHENDMSKIIHYAQALGEILRVAEAPIETRIDDDTEAPPKGKAAGGNPAGKKSAK